MLQKLQACGLIPPSNEVKIAERDKTKHPGKEGLYGQLLPIIHPFKGLDGRAIVLMDLDGNSHQGLQNEFRDALKASLRNDTVPIKITDGNRVGRLEEIVLEYEERRGSVVLVPVGNPEDKEVSSKYGIDRFAIDDWILKLALHQQAFEAVSEFEKLGYDRALKKFEEVSDLLRNNSLEVRKAKTYVQILRLIADIRPSTATVIGRIVEKAFASLGREEFTRLLKPFLSDLNDASSILRRTES
ncbi:hypothetical protein KIH39_07225 [Telmatocola sphagniphila]|uniref:Uncharacterized protein n=1 Tax=Telmatocola sphagniphila TaxID=1123043 RepID=A0A8E6B967_9BACT|nr:hypothetical protein [Telmatocola sphagniphila]QVL33692.1 hypothetical protein KIH39_07225 [Telmatocola sphagniphila]